MKYRILYLFNFSFSNKCFSNKNTDNDLLNRMNSMLKQTNTNDMIRNSQQSEKTWL